MNTYGPKVTFDQLSRGVRIYYTGDAANRGGAGRVTKKWISERFGYRMVNIRMDDGRSIKAIDISNFQPAPGRRFWLAADYEAARLANIDRMRQDMMARHSAPAAQ